MPALIIVLAVLLVVFLFHTVMSVVEQKKYPFPGKMLQFDDENLHVYSMGKKSERPTVVILHDCGDCAPAVRHYVLMSKISQKNRVVTVERCGSGWSGDTFAARTAKDIVYEYRTALEGAGENESSYILVPFGSAACFAQYWKTNFPDEVEQIIPVAASAEKKPAPFTAGVIALLRGFGFLRLYNYFVTVSDEAMGGNTAAYKALANSRTMSAAMREELQAFAKDEKNALACGQPLCSEEEADAICSAAFKAPLSQESLG